MTIAISTVQRVNAAVQVGRGPILLGLRIALLLLVAVCTVAVGLGSSSGLRYALAMSAVYALAALANGVVLGGLGEINLSTGGWLALGAYVAGNAVMHGWPVTWAVAAAIAASTLVGFLVAIPTVRLRGIFTALATFVLAWAVPQTLVYLERFTGGSHGMSLPLGQTWLGFELGGSSTGQLIVSWACFGVAALATLALAETRWGRRALWVGEAESAAAVFGVQVMWVKVALWTWAALLAGLAGALFALTVGFLSPEQFPATLGINLFVVAVIAGARSVWAAVPAGLLIGVVPTQLQTFITPSATGLIFGAILLIAILSGTGGLARLVESGLTAVWLRLRGASHV